MGGGKDFMFCFGKWVCELPREGQWVQKLEKMEGSGSLWSIGLCGRFYKC